MLAANKVKSFRNRNYCFAPCSRCSEVLVNPNEVICVSRGQLHCWCGPAIKKKDSDESHMHDFKEKHFYIRGKHVGSEIMEFITPQSNIIGPDNIKRTHIARFDNGQFHHDTLPAYEHICGDSTIAQYWMRDGIVHREDGPAIIFPGLKYWIQHGNIHNKNGPAIVVEMDKDYGRINIYAEQGFLAYKDLYVELERECDNESISAETYRHDSFIPRYVINLVRKYKTYPRMRYEDCDAQLWTMLMTRE